MRSKKRDYGVELPPPFIIMNQQCQVWTGLRDGGRRAVFSNNLDEAKSLHYDIQFNTYRYTSYVHFNLLHPFLSLFKIQQ
jgi:hypothetical protein